MSDEVCKDCREPDAGIACMGRCRECDIEYALETNRCPDCGHMCWSAMGRELFGCAPTAHDDANACPWVAL